MNFKKSRRIKYIKNRITRIQKLAIENGADVVVLKQLNQFCNIEVQTFVRKGYRDRSLIILLVVAFSCLVISLCSVVNSLLGTRCLLASNYLVWEATRPLADCNYCTNVTKPIILENATKREFLQYAYLSKPIVVKKSINNWKAVKKFNFNFFRRLYEQTDGSYESLEEGCQFLNFKTDLYSLKEVFNMHEARASNEPGQAPWYVGWGNCHPDILAKVRKYYEIPHFLPEDAEFPATENIFFGYEMGAVMHLDYIPRLMWQGQVKGSKIWTLAPVPECDHVCNKFQYYVEPGDVVLLDTRLWYHATRIPKGQFSITVQSEYG